MDRIRMIISSEDQSARKGLAAIFTSESIFEVVGDFPMEEAMEKASAFQPDVVLLDITGDISNYLSEIARIKQECPCSIILVMGESLEYHHLTEIIQQGIDGFIPGGIIRGCLVRAVELACRADMFCLPGAYKKMVQVTSPDKIINPGQPQKNVPDVIGSLTKREVEVLQLMARNYSNREIASRLFISEPTVKSHVSSILRKLGQENRAQAIVYCYRKGLISDSLTAFR